MAGRRRIRTVSCIANMNTASPSASGINRARASWGRGTLTRLLMLCGSSLPLPSPSVDPSWACWKGRVAEYPPSGPSPSASPPAAALAPAGRLDEPTGRGAPRATPERPAADVPLPEACDPGAVDDVGSVGSETPLSPLWSIEPSGPLGPAAAVVGGLTWATLTAWAAM